MRNIIIIILISLKTIAQSNFCGGAINLNELPPSMPNNCSGTSSAYQTKYRLQSNYIPNSNTSLIKLNITIHVFTNNDGTGLFQNDNNPNNGIGTLNSILSIVLNNRDRMSVPRIASYNVPGFVSNPIPDSKIDFVVTNIYFYPNTTMNNLSSPSNDANLVNYINGIDPNRLNEGLPIIISNNGYAGHQTGSPIDGSPLVITSGNVQLQGEWWYESHLRHEIGHCFGLGHTYPNSALGGGSDWQNFGGSCGSIDYLSDVFPSNNPMCVPTNPPCNSCYEDGTLGPNYSNNLMGGRTVPNNNEWMSPLQMGRRIRNMHLFKIRKFAADEESDHVNIWNIMNNEIWDFDIQMYNDIVVKTGKTLTVKCKIAMAKGGKIIVEKGAKLVVDGGEITTWSKTGLWRGIELDGNVNQNQNYSGGYAIYQGMAELFNGATISKASDGITTGITDVNGNFVWGTQGGVIIANNTNFINNAQDIEFLPYSITNKSYFTKCNFIVNDALVGTALPVDRVTMWNVQGVKFNGCNFDFSATSIYQGGLRGDGIYSIDALYYVDQVCNTNLNPCVGGFTKCEFKNFDNGIKAENTNPLRVVSIKNTNFYDNVENGVYFNNINSILFEKNYIRTPKVYGFSGGLYLNNCKYYNVRNNTFIESGTGVSSDVGVFVNNSQAGVHNIYRNSFSNFSIGIDAMENNSGMTNMSDGLKMNCNNFSLQNNQYDIVVLGNNPSVAHVQGNVIGANSGNVVRNIYGAACGNQNKWHVSSTSTKIIQHGANSDANTRPQPQPSCSSNLLNIVNSGFALNYAVDCPEVQSSGGGGGGGSGKSVMLSNIISNNLDVNNTNQKSMKQDVSYEYKIYLTEKLNQLLLDSISSSKDSVITLLENNPETFSDFEEQLVFAHVNKGDFGSAIKIAKKITEKNDDNWGLLFEKLVAFYQNDKNILSLKENNSIKQELGNYVTMKNEKVNGSYNTLLKFVDGQSYYTPKHSPNENSYNNRNINFDDSNDIINGSSFKLLYYPNPVVNQLNVAYKSNDNKFVQIKLLDIYGSSLFIKEINNSSFFSIPVDKIGSGIYFLVLYDGNNLLESQKVVIVK